MTRFERCIRRYISSFCLLHSVQLRDSNDHINQAEVTVECAVYAAVGVTAFFWFEYPEEQAVIVDAKGYRIINTEYFLFLSFVYIRIEQQKNAMAGTAWATKDILRESFPCSLTSQCKKLPPKLELEIL